MPSPHTPLRALTLLLAVSCGAPATLPHAGAPVTSGPSALEAPSEPGPVGPPSPVPVSSDDATWGEAFAPVTIVAFFDLECAFCGRVQPTLAELARRYGPGQLRIVWKHLPLPFHPHADPAARAARAVRDLRGDDVFFDYVGQLFAHQDGLEIEILESTAEGLGIPRQELRTAMDAPRTRARVAEDVALGGRLGVQGTPQFLINGVRVQGAQPLPTFTAIIDREILEASLLRAKGTSPLAVYAGRTAVNFQDAPAPGEAPPDAAETAVWNVPLGDSPRLGSDDALVTIVEFSDFECSFCKRAHDTLAQVRARYGSDVRVVWKHAPLPFHPRAIPAATLAIEARKQRGDAGFWRAVDGLFGSAPALDGAALDRVATELSLDARRAHRAVEADRHRAIIQADLDVGGDFDVRGTPLFFINGRRLSGAVPLEDFVAAIDPALVEARAVVARGVPRAGVYAELMRAGSGPPPPEQRAVPAPTAANPSRGPANAPVVIQIFSDLECPFCKRTEPTLGELMKRFPGKIRIVYRHLPLPFHEGARPAATAAVEAFVQKGPEAFWKMKALLEAEQDDPSPLTRADLLEHAVTLHLDLTRFAQALDHGTHDPAIDADVQVATAAGIEGTPAFVVNGYFISGAQPLAVFERVVKRALGEATPARRVAK